MADSKNHNQGRGANNQKPGDLGRPMSGSPDRPGMGSSSQGSNEQGGSMGQGGSVGQGGSMSQDPSRGTEALDRDRARTPSGRADDGTE